MKRKILSILLAAVMLLSLMAGLSGCGSGNQAKTPGTQKSETFTVEDGQTALASEDGAAIDFGCLLEAGEELTIQKVSPASISTMSCIKTIFKTLSRSTASLEYSNKINAIIAKCQLCSASFSFLSLLINRVFRLIYLTLSISFINSICLNNLSDCIFLAPEKQGSNLFR